MSVACCYIDGNGQILKANALWLRLFCLPEHGRSVFECMSSSPHELMHMLAKERFDGCIEFEARWQVPTGLPRWFTWRVACEGDSSYFIVLQEITPLKMAQNELMFAKNSAETSLEQLRQNMQLKSAFLSNMSHEIRTPLNGFLGVLSLLKDTRLDTEQTDYVSLMDRSGQAMFEVINDVLDLSRLEANKTELLPQKIDLRALVEEVAVLAASTLKERPLDLGWTVDRQLPEEVIVDGVRLRQVLSNLMTNAVKFTEEGEVHTTLQVLHSEGCDLHVQFDISDTGMGIEPERLTHIFEPFAQVLSSKRLDATGTGLGLAICQRLVDAMGGDMSVTSQPGEGSTFTFILPMTASSSAVDTPLLLEPVPCVDMFTHHPRRVHLIRELFETRGIPVKVHQELGSWTPGDGLIFVDVQDVDLEDFSLVVPSFGPAQHLIALVKMGSSTAAYKSHDIVADVLNLPLRQSSLLRLVKRLYSGRMEHERQETRTIKLDALDLGSLDEDSFGLLESFSTLVKEITHAPVMAAHTILLAEDHPVNQLITMKMLRALGYEVELCKHGAQACEALETRAYAAVLMDCQMPILDGYSATARIRHRERTLHAPHVPIIGLSACAFEGEKERALEAGMDAYLSKPVSRDELADTLRHWIKTTSTGREPTPAHFAPQSFAEEPLLDEQRLLTLIKSCGDMGFVLELVAIYEIANTQSQSILRELAQTWSREVADREIKLQAHTMKGSADSMGLHRLTCCMSHLEHHATDIRQEEFIAYLDHVEMVSGVSLRALKQWMEGVTAASQAPEAVT